METLGSMDLGSLLRGNATAAADGLNESSKLMDNMMENLLPLVGRGPLLRTFIIVYQMIGSNLGLDPTIILTVAGFLWALQRIFKQVYSTIYAFIQENFMSNVHISSTDEIYLHLMKWLAMQPYLTGSRSLMAETVSKTAWEEEEETSSKITTATSEGGRYLNFSNQEAKAPPRFVPALGVHGFWFDGKYYRLHRKQQSFFEDGGFQTFKEKEDLVISCFGRNPEPIKRFIQHAKEAYYSDHFARTTVRRPSPQNLRRYGGRYSWTQVANRPVRPMRTVVLDPTQKRQVLDDMNEYLHPATPRWYASRGIPLRRGYLFHGPPGTGKTSLSFALAGVFGLDIYVISLLEPTLTEEDLGGLFNSLPRRCVVLLEDIDTAGLRRKDDDADQDAEGKEEGKEESKEKDKKSRKKENSDSDKHRNDWKVSDLARALKKEGTDGNKDGISLSGLLNAIDGVASHEGRVLIMTTNKPESLDEALIRPGRVDLQVGFTNATRLQAAELFQRMYEVGASHPLHTSPAKLAAATAATAATDSATDDEKKSEAGSDFSAGSSLVNVDENSGPTHTGEVDIDHGVELTAEELLKVANEFGAKIPEGLFSPAEIQGFLLKRKTTPRKALLEADGWVEAMIKQKEMKVKVLSVQ